MKRLGALGVVLAVVLSIVFSTPVAATTKPQNYVSYFITSVRAVPDGMAIELTGAGQIMGLDLYRAQQLAKWAKDLYEKDGGKNFFAKRSVNDLAIEIWLHCVVRNNPVNAGLDDGWRNGYGAWD